MLQWAKRSLATALGEKKDIVKNFPIIKKLNEKANIELDSSRQELLEENYKKVLEIIYNSDFSGFDIWLDFGTLLGAYREKGLIKHDLDMDFGIIIEDFEEFKKEEKKLFEKGFQKTREFKYNGEIVELSYDYNGLNVDFIIYKKEDEYIKSITIIYLLDVLNRPCKFDSREYKIKFEGITSASLEGIEVNIPINTHEYLEYQYEKDFLTPNEFYDWRNNPMYKKVDTELIDVKLFKN